MKKNLIYSAFLASTLFIVSCDKKDDDKPQPTTADKAKVGTLLKKMDSFGKYLDLTGSFSPGTVGKSIGNHVMSDTVGVMDGVMPIKTQDGTSTVYTYNFNGTHYAGTLKLTIDATAHSFGMTFVKFEDKTLGYPNLTDGYITIVSTETPSGVETAKINSDLTVVENGQTSKFKCTDLTTVETPNGPSETNGLMEITIGTEKITFEFLKVIEAYSCDYNGSGVIKITSVDTSKNTTESFAIDFGNGTCDNKAMLTVNGGAAVEINLDDDMY